MGSSCSKNTSSLCEKDVKTLREKIRVLREEVKEAMYQKEKERSTYERNVMVLAFKEAEWKQERKRMNEEVRRLRKEVEEKEERIREKNCGEEKELYSEEMVVVEQMMREERARRDEAAEKWKRLYLAIKTELDHLLQRTTGDGLYWRAEQEDMMEQLKRELKAKEDIIEALKERVASMECEEYKREREVDILRQSLRIMSHKKVTTQVAKKSYASQFGLVKQSIKL